MYIKDQIGYLIGEDNIKVRWKEYIEQVLNREEEHGINEIGEVEEEVNVSPISELTSKR